MSQYNPNRTRNLYTPGSRKSYRLSRAKIEMFIECRRCFYIDRRLGVGRPPTYPFNLNSAVDTLLKTEFDIYRHCQSPHPLMTKYGIDAVPYQHEKLVIWRHNFKGVEYLHEPTNLLVTGAVDDLWQAGNGSVHVVDYKATSKQGEVSLGAAWQNAYKRQMEVYQWLLRRNGLPVSDTGYFVYCNGDRGKGRFDSKLEFRVVILPHIGDDKWVARAIDDISACLDDDEIPDAGRQCDFCRYREAALLANVLDGQPKVPEPRPAK